MKNIIYLSGIAAVSLLMASCSLDNEQPSSMEAEVVFTTPELANSAVMGIHQSFGETNSYRGRYIPYFGINSDCEIFNNYGGVSDPATDKEASLAIYSASDDNTYMNTSNNAWAKLYEGIERANMAIQSMEKYSDLTNKTMNHLYGELLTLRAMIYFDLVKAWGDVPYRFEPVTSGTLYLPTTDRVTILKKVLADLENAENRVYDANTSYAASTERVSKSFVRGLYARIALFLAGQSEQITGTLDYNIKDASERKAYYEKALAMCERCIANHPAKLEGLPFIQNFKNLCQDVTTAGLESIFEIPFSAGRGRVLYTWGGKHSTVSKFTGLAAGGKNGPIPTLWYDYDPQDSRRNITVVPFVWQAESNGKKETVNGDEVPVPEKGTSNLTAGGWSFGKLRFEWMTRRVTSSNDDGVNWQVMRLADVYMMAAEAADYLGDVNTAETYLHAVMDRAYGSTLASTKISDAEGVAVTDAPEGYQGKLFDLIVDERKFEFAGEALRKVDLMRWGLLSKKMAEAKDNLTALEGRQGKYSNYNTKIYYNNGMTAIPGHPELTIGTGDDAYSVWGLEAGQTGNLTDATGAKITLDNSNYVFSSANTTPADKAKTQKYVDDLYLNDPDTKMFWPIWKVFINSSNGMLKNYYGY